MLAILVYYSEKEDRVVKDKDAPTQFVPNTPMFGQPSDERAHHGRQHQRTHHTHRENLNETLLANGTTTV